jgi:iduronate 2-sulfatase
MRPELSWLSTSSLYFLLLVSLLGCSEKGKNTTLIEQPNFLFIAIDDLNDWSEVLGGHPQSLTPNLSSFSDEAVNFTRNYCVSPGCNPSRTSTMTGLYTFNSGMYSNYQDWRKVEKSATAKHLAQYFRENGYFTAGAGKIYHYNQVHPQSWDEYYPSQKQNMPADYLPENRPVNMPPFKYMYKMFDWAALDADDSSMADHKSVSYISNLLAQKHDQPFFLACGIYRPHLPWYVPKKYFDRFPLDGIKLPPILDGDTTDLGVRAKELISRGGNYHRHVVEAGKWQEAVRAYLASIAAADAMLGLLLDNLNKSQYAKNTIVVIWSDHGWQLGEKMHWRKFALWENVNRTLLLIKVPQGVAYLPKGSNNGKSTASLTSLVDIYPTLVELAQLPPRPDLDGNSLVPILQNPDTIIDRSIITTYDFADYSIRKDNWHYIKYVDDSEELYDLTSDPEEWYNLALDEKYRPKMDELAMALPKNPVPIADSSLIELQEHHIPPVTSRAYYFSKERQQRLKRFEEID